MFDSVFRVKMGLRGSKMKLMPEESTLKQRKMFSENRAKLRFCWDFWLLFPKNISLKCFDSYKNKDNPFQLELLSADRGGE